MRDERTKAVLNSNTDAIRAYQQNRALQERINSLEDVIKVLENRVNTLEENGNETK